MKDFVAQWLILFIERLEHHFPGDDMGEGCCPNISITLNGEGIPTVQIPYKMQFHSWYCDEEDQYEPEEYADFIVGELKGMFE